MPQFLSSIGNDQFIDANGDPLTGGRVETYLAGSSTSAATYTSSSGATPQANPIILNSLGYAPSPIWLTGGVAYKFIIKDASGSTLRTIDDISGVNDASVSQSEWVESGLVPTFISATSFSVPGDQTPTLQIGRRLRTTNTSGLVYSTISNSTFAAGITTVTLTNSGTPLDAGLSLVAYALLAAFPSSAPPIQSGLKNLLINGNFAINQRAYVSGAAVGAANTYTLDRWRVVTSGQSLTFSASGNGNQITAPAGGVEQVIEGLSIAGGSYVLNWTGTATATVGGTARTKGEVFTLTAGANVTVRFTGGTVSVAQLEPGTVATPFEPRPYGLERELCKRYFTTVNMSLAGYTQLGVSNSYYQTLSPFMRATPTVTATGVINTNVTGSAVAAVSSETVSLNSTGAGTGGFVSAATATLSAEL